MTEVAREREVHRVAHELITRNPDWVTFFREILGNGGVIHRLFRDPRERAEFEQSQTYHEIQQMLKKLREKRLVIDPEEEPTSVITVRLPTVVYDALKREAGERMVSVNKLCITKLLQYIDDELVPRRR